MSMKINMTRFPKSWIFLGLVVFFVMFVRLRLLDIPLERDEGEFAYMGQLLLQGVGPYSEAYNMKFPGVYVMYALIMAIFGENIRGVHIGLMLINCAAIILLFHLARKMMEDFAAVIACAAFAVLSLSPGVLGFAAHATHFVVLPALCGSLLLLLATEKEKADLYFFSGLMMGVALVMKQPGVFFVLFGFFYILCRFISSRPPSLKVALLNLGAFVFGAGAPLLITFIWIYYVGAFDKFWFWTIQYASAYGSQVPLSEAFSVFESAFSRVTGDLLLLWVVAALGLAAMLSRRDFRNKLFMLLFALFSFLTVCPGFYFRYHYFITVLPAVAILTGIFFDTLYKKGSLFMKPRAAVLACSAIFLAVISFGMTSQKAYFFKDEPVKISRAVYRSNPFAESLEIAKFIRSATSASDKIAVLGSEPQIFFYSGRRSATGYIYMYSLTELHAYSLRMQKEMMNEITASFPKLIVVVQVPASWQMFPGSEKYMFRRLDEYIKQYYRVVGVADMVSPGLTVYKWLDDAANYTPMSPSRVLIYERTGYIPRRPRPS